MVHPREKRMLIKIQDQASIRFVDVRIEAVGIWFLRRILTALMQMIQVLDIEYEEVPSIIHYSLIEIFKLHKIHRKIKGEREIKYSVCILKAEFSELL